jgi:tetratricopeptide (TPR) repeat protein
MTGRQDVFQQAMNQGHSAAWDERWEKAATYYRQALAEFPDNPQALASLGLALIELQDFDEALICYQKAAKTMPDDPLPLEKIAQLSERVGNLDLASHTSLRAAELYMKNHDAAKAIESWERVTRLNPESLPAHSRLAWIYERLGDKAKAIKAYLATASILQSNGNLEKAMQAANQAMKIMPSNEEVIQALNLLKDFKPLPKPARPRGGTAPLRMSQVRQMQSPQTAAAPDLDPVAQARQKALTVLAGMLFEGGDEDEEADSERRGLHDIVTGKTGELKKPVDHKRMILHLSQVVDLQTRGETAQALDELQRAIDVGMEHPAAYFDMGYLYAQAGRMESAIRHLQHSFKHADFALGSRLLLGDLLRKRGQVREASFEYLEALKLADTQVVASEHANDLRQLYDLLIESYRQRTDPTTQVRLCDNIHSMLMRPDWRAQITRARKQLPGQAKGGQPLPLAELLTEARSGQVIDSVSAIYAMIDKGFYRTAIEEAFRTLQDAPTYLPLHSIVGDILVKEGDSVNAVIKYQVVARAYAARGEAQQAIGFLRKVVDLAPTDLGARGRLIEQLISYGKFETAIDEYCQLAAVYYSLADLNMARKTYTEALRTAQQAKVERSLRVKILHRMADIDLQSLDWRQAMRVLEQIRTLQPDDQETRSQLIQLNLRLGQEQQALAELDNYMAFLSSANQIDALAPVLENLVTENPERIPLRRRLVDLYRHLGRTSDAITQLDAIGDILLEAGDRAAAIQTVETILSLEPPNKLEYQQLLEQLRFGV